MEPNYNVVFYSVRLCDATMRVTVILMTTLTFPGAHGPRSTRQVVTENIRALMARRGIKQPQIMALLELSQPAVSRRLSGQLPWNIDELERIARAFEVSVAELIDGTAESPHPGPDGDFRVVRREGIEPPTRWFRGGRDLARVLPKAA